MLIKKICDTHSNGPAYPRTALHYGKGICSANIETFLCIFSVVWPLLLLLVVSVYSISNAQDVGPDWGLNQARQQCDQMARLFLQCLTITRMNNEHVTVVVVAQLADVVASNNRGLQFESSHWLLLID